MGEHWGDTQNGQETNDAWEYLANILSDKLPNNADNLYNIIANADF